MVNEVRTAREILDYCQHALKIRLPPGLSTCNCAPFLMANTYRYFPGRGIQWLQARLERIQEDIAAGKTLTSWGSGGDSASRQVNTDPLAVQRMLLNDLNIVAPATYPVESLRRIHCTTAVFRDL